MDQAFLSVVNNSEIAPGIFEMNLTGDISEIKIPGQFINIRVNGYFLRRPISVSNKLDDYATILYKVVGKGTEALSHYNCGDQIDALCGLGNGFDLQASENKKTLLIGGGIGIAPLVWLGKELADRGVSVTSVLGYNSSKDMFYLEKFKEFGPVVVSTADGSKGIKGFVTDCLMGLDYDYFYSCGPEAMLKAVFQKTNSSGQFSFEERMGCGFGACMGCTCHTVTGWKRICKDGPVLNKEELLWED